MAEDPPNRSYMDLVGGPGRGSAFLHNGFVSLNDQPQPKQDDKKSDGEDGLFVEDDVAPAGNGLSWENPIKLKDDEDGNDSDQRDPSDPSNSSCSMAQHTNAHPAGGDPNQESRSGLNAPTALTTSINVSHQRGQLQSHIKQETVNQEEDDGDFMILDPDDVPAETRAKFAGYSFKPIVPDLEIIGVDVKQEEPAKDEPSPSVIGSNEHDPDVDIKDEPLADNASLFSDDEMPDVEESPKDMAADAPSVSEDEEGLFVRDFPDPPGNNIAPVEVGGNSTPRNAEARGSVDTQSQVIPGPGNRGPIPASGPHQVSYTSGSSAPASGSAAISGAYPTGTTPISAIPKGPGPSEASVHLGLASHPGDASSAEPANGDSTQEEPDGDVEDDWHGFDADNENVVENDNGDAEFVIGDDEELSDGERPRTNRRKQTRKKKSAESTRSATLDAGTDDDGDDDMQDFSELDREDLEDELKLLEAELEVYSKRKEKGRLGRRDEAKLEQISLKIGKLKHVIETSQPTAEERAAEGLRKMLEQEDSADEEGQTGRSKKKRKVSRIPALARGRINRSPTSPAQKRKANSRPATSASRNKKQRTNSKTGRRNKVNISRNTHALLELVQSNDPIAARARMDDMQVFAEFKANTVKEQIQKLKEQIRADPDADNLRVNADLKQLAIARKAFGRKFCKPKDGQWHILGMSKLLHHYQLVGAGWMLRREIGQNGPPLGGILADSVGLGKTIEALACIMGNPLSDDEKTAGKFGTLIVVPSNLLGQWQDEIDAWCPDTTVVHYHLSKSNPVRMSSVRKAEIVITTYYEIAKGFPHKEKLKLLEGLDGTQLTEKLEQSLGELFTVEWHRIILDEAHAIKNISTHTSKACINLKGKHRWCLTATPLHNGLYEVLPYMQFTGAVDPDPIADPTDKRSRRPRLTQEEINNFLENAMMKREITNLFLGKALFDIPRPHPQPNVWISLSEEETIIYRRIEGIIRKRINRARAMPGQMKKRATATFFSLAIRLRQAVSHPYTLFYLMRDVYEVSDIKEIRQQMRDIKHANPNRRFIEQVGSWCETQLANGTIEGKVLNNANIPEQFGQGDHGLEFNMDPQLAKLEKLKSGHGGICTICGEPPTAPRKTRCNHVFCRDCIEGLIETEKSEGSENINCPICNKEYGVSELMGHPRKRRAVNPTLPGSDWSGIQPLGDEESAAFLSECDQNPNLAMAPSAKTAMVKDIVLKWGGVAPDDKIIVFTQWVVVGRVLGRMLQQEGIGFIYFFGEMTRQEKDNAVKIFHAVPEIKVMIASLKCGGQGLNLTCANRVILVDPWWNAALERQGYGRVFRMGQKKETYYVRLLTRKTIDGRMAKLQAKKLKEINAAIKDFDSTRTSLNFEEVAELFGRVVRDEDGNMIEVESDYDTDEEEEEEGEDHSPGAADDIEPLGGDENDGVADDADDGASPDPGPYGIQDLI